MSEMEIIQAVQSVGFPIVSFLLMFWLVRTTITENTKALLSLKDTIENMRFNK